VVQLVEISESVEAVRTILEIASRSKAPSSPSLVDVDGDTLVETDDSPKERESHINALQQGITAAQHLFEELSETVTQASRQDEETWYDLESSLHASQPYISDIDAGPSQQASIRNIDSYIEEAEKEMEKARRSLDSSNMDSFQLHLETAERWLLEARKSVKDLKSKYNFIYEKQYEISMTLAETYTLQSNYTDARKEYEFVAGKVTFSDGLTDMVKKGELLCRRAELERTMHERKDDARISLENQRAYCYRAYNLVHGRLVPARPEDERNEMHQNIDNLLKRCFWALHSCLLEEKNTVAARNLRADHPGLLLSSPAPGTNPDRQKSSVPTIPQTLCSEEMYTLNVKPTRDSAVSGLKIPPCHPGAVSTSPDDMGSALTSVSSNGSASTPSSPTPGSVSNLRARSSIGDVDLAKEMALRPKQLKDDLFIRVVGSVPVEKLKMPDSDSRTPLMLAARYKADELISLIIERLEEADEDSGCNLVDKDGCNVLHHALDRADINALDVRTIETLIGRVTDLNAADAHGETPLHYCASYGNVTICELLLRKYRSRVDINAKDKVRRTPVFLAARRNKVAMVQSLCKQGAAIDPLELDRLNGTCKKLLQQELKRRRCG
jgi:hypothetical protein